MVREISAGGVVVKRTGEDWFVAVIEPQREAFVVDAAKTAAKNKKKAAQKMLLALPKGLVDPGEKPEQTAIREVLEETGLQTKPVSKLADIKYVYVRTWGDQQRVFKIVTFYLLRYVSGRIDDISPEMRIEVKRAFWLPLEEAAQKLSYRGERDVVRKAEGCLKSQLQVDA
jgi:8-oxo-dGTP pyrophosphatase MutT (NUDIX family)